MRRKMLFTIFKYLFSFQKLAMWWHHILNQILIRYDEQRYLSQFESEMFESWQYDYMRGAPQYKPNIFDTMAMFWVPDFPILRASLATFSVLSRYLPMILICMIQQAFKYVRSCSWPCVTFFELKISKILKSGLKRVGCHGNWNFNSHRCVACRTNCLWSFQWFLQIDLDSSIYILDVMLGWVSDVISLLICIF